MMMIDEDDDDDDVVVGQEFGLHGRGDDNWSSSMA